MRGPGASRAGRYCRGFCRAGQNARAGAVRRSIRNHPMRVCANWPSRRHCSLLKPTGSSVTGDARQPRAFGKPTGDNTMVTKQDDALIFRNLIALATLEALGSAIALGLAFNLLSFNLLR